MVIEQLTYNDIPSVFRWETPWRPAQVEELQASLGLRPGRTRDINTVMGYVLGQTLVTYRADPDSWISYSRNQNWYRHHGRQQYFPVPTAYASMLSAVDQLASTGLIDHRKSAPGSRGQQSRFRGTAELLRLYNEHPTPLICTPRERIILRDAHGTAAAYKNSRDTDRWRKQVLAFNEGLITARIELDGKIIKEGDAVWVNEPDTEWWQPPRKVWGTATLSLHRIWNENWRRNGRLYGCWIQNLPKRDRHTLVLNKESVAEPDYPALHCRLLYDRAGKAIPDRPFEIDGWGRSEVKRAFYTMVNAATWDAARRAITGHLKRSGAAELMQAVAFKHSAVSELLCSGIGAQLMFIDAQIMCQNLTDLNRAGILALPIHDSVIVQAKNEGRALEIMERNLAMKLEVPHPQKPARQDTDITRENIEPHLHNGDGRGTRVVPPGFLSAADSEWLLGSVGSELALAA
jgi:hypothetical protein